MMNKCSNQFWLPKIIFIRRNSERFRCAGNKRNVIIVFCLLFSSFSFCCCCFVCSAHVAISVTISGIGAFLAFLWKSDTECEEYFIILYIRCVYWILTFVSWSFDRSSVALDAMTMSFIPFIVFQLYDNLIKYHHENLRMSGYHEFYRATLIHKGIPLHTVSLWNTIILLIQTIMQHEYGPDFLNHCTKSFFSPTAYVVIFCSLETVILILVHGTYIRRVMRFNEAALPPDVFRGLSTSVNSVSNKKTETIFCAFFQLIIV